MSRFRYAVIKLGQFVNERVFFWSGRGESTFDLGFVAWVRFLAHQLTFLQQLTSTFDGVNGSDRQTSSSFGAQPVRITTVRTDAGASFARGPAQS